MSGDTKPKYVAHNGYVYKRADLVEEARRSREHAAAIEHCNPEGARQARAGADRIDRALGLTDITTTES